MTRLTVAEVPMQGFSVRGRSAITKSDDEGLIFYDDVTKVQVLPDEQRFTVQIITPDVEVEIDFPDADSVREALALFASKKVSEVNGEAPGSVRITPVESGPISSDAKLQESVEVPPASGESFLKPPEDMPEQVVSSGSTATRKPAGHTKAPVGISSCSSTHTPVMSLRS
ncbi:MAG: hypothetical protein JOZ08_05185 [Verrucomicrobia bacterium]|nr:hypothetical protein [Verrucomicrobiota bacterium]